MTPNTVWPHIAIPVKAAESVHLYLLALSREYGNMLYRDSTRITFCFSLPRTNKFRLELHSLTILSVIPKTRDPKNFRLNKARISAMIIAEYEVRGITGYNLVSSKDASGFKGLGLYVLSKTIARQLVKIL